MDWIYLGITIINIFIIIDILAVELKNQIEEGIKEGIKEVIK